MVAVNAWARLKILLAAATPRHCNACLPPSPPRPTSTPLTTEDLTRPKWLSCVVTGENLLVSKIVASQGVKVMAEYAVKNDSSAIKLRYGLVQWVFSCFDVCACVCVGEKEREAETRSTE